MQRRRAKTEHDLSSDEVVGVQAMARVFLDSRFSFLDSLNLLFEMTQPKLNSSQHHDLKLN